MKTLKIILEVKPIGETLDQPEELGTVMSTEVPKTNTVAAMYLFHNVIDF